jgi:hypothetical protein
MKRAFYSGILALCACAATSGGAVHPEDGKPNTTKYCASGAAEEQNCMACASKPGCGFCAEPTEGATVCQPGTNDQAQSGSCSVALIISNEECAGPPPAPEHSLAY